MAYFGGVVPKRLPLCSVRSAVGASSALEAHAVAPAGKSPCRETTTQRARRAAPVLSFPLLTAVPRYGSRPRK